MTTYNNVLNIPPVANEIVVATASGFSLISGVISSGLLTDSGGVPGWVAYTGSGAPVLATSPSLVNPLISIGIKDINNNFMLTFSPTVSAVNFLAMQNTATGNTPTFFTQGADANIPLSINSKGDAGIVLHTDAVSAFPLSIISGTALQHTTNFQFSNTSATNTVTFQDSSGTVAYTSQLPSWVDQTTSSVAMVINTGYTSDDGASLVTFTLPTSASIGDSIEIQGKGAGLWKIAQATGQQIFFGAISTTSGATGTLSSSLQYDSVKLRALTSGATSTWSVVSSVGNLSYV